MTDGTPRPGARTFTAEDRQAAVRAKRKRQVEHDQAVWPRISELRDQGLSWRQICRTLEAEGIPTPSGRSRWQPVQVQRIARRQAPQPAPRSSSPGRFLQWFRRCLTH